MADRRLTFADVASLLGIVGGAGLFGASAGFASGSLGGGLVPFGEGDNDVATSYPTTTMHVELGSTTNNGELQREVAQKAAKMQELNEHNRALTKFLHPGQTKAERIEAIRKGKEAEKRLWSFWNDNTPRVDYTPSSSAVEAIRITDKNRVEVKWRNSKKTDNDGFYTFLAAPDPYQASEAFQALVTAPSIGRAVWPILTRNIKGKRENNLGWWNMTHFDPSKSPAMK